MLKTSERFKQIRNYLNLSQTEMSAKMGISKNAWQSYELGKSSPGIRSLFLTSSRPERRGLP